MYTLTSIQIYRTVIFTRVHNTYIITRFRKYNNTRRRGYSDKRGENTRPIILRKRYKIPKLQISMPSNILNNI